MTIPYSNPTDRHEARQNAIYYAEQARSDGTGRDLLQAQVWADIARTFPEEGQSMTVELTGDEVVVDDVSEYWRNLVDKGVQRATAPSSGTRGADTTMVVSTVAWDVLRALAIRYVLSSMDGQATVDFLDDNEENRDLTLERASGFTVVARITR